MIDILRMTIPTAEAYTALLASPLRKTWGFWSSDSSHIHSFLGRKFPDGEMTFLEYLPTSPVAYFVTSSEDHSWAGDMLWATFGNDIDQFRQKQKRASWPCLIESKTVGAQLGDLDDIEARHGPAILSVPYPGPLAWTKRRVA